MTDSSRTREHLEVLADALATPGEGAKPPATLTRRWCPKCGRTGRDPYALGDAHNPAWPDASPVVCRGPVRTLTYDLRPEER